MKTYATLCGAGVLRHSPPRRIVAPPLALQQDEAIRIESPSHVNTAGSYSAINRATAGSLLSPGAVTVRYDCGIAISLLPPRGASPESHRHSLLACPRPLVSVINSAIASPSRLGLRCSRFHWQGAGPVAFLVISVDGFVPPAVRE